MGEDELMELVRKSGQVVQSSESQRPSPDKSSPPPPPPILRGSGSGGGEEENAPISLPPPMHHQNLLIQEDEMEYWLHPSYRHQYYHSQLLYPNPATPPQSSVSLAPSPILPAEIPTSQILDVTMAENLMNFPWLRSYISTGSRVEVPVVREWTQVDSNTTPSSSATQSLVIPETERTESRKGKAVAIEIGRTPSSGAETEPTQATDTVIAGITGPEEGPGSTSRKRSRDAEMHNLYERRRRARMNELMKTLGELTPHCRKSAMASVLADVIDYVKYLERQMQMISNVQQMMYAGNMQQFMSHMLMSMMGMNLSPFIPFPSTPLSMLPHTGPYPALPLDPPYPALPPDPPYPPYPAMPLDPPYPAPPLDPPYPPYPAPPLDPPYPDTNTSQPYRVDLQTPQPNPGSNQPHLPTYMNPNGYFVGLLEQMQQPPPPLEGQTTTPMSFSHASGSGDLQDPDIPPPSD